MSASAAQGGHIKTRFWATLTNNGSPYATGPLSCLSVCQSVCLSVTLVYCGQTVGWVKMPLGTETGLGPGDIVLDGDCSYTHGKGYSSPHFSTHVYCGQTAGWIMVPLGTEVGFRPGNIVLDGNPPTPRKGAQQPPLVGPCLLWANGCPSQQLLSSCSLLLIDKLHVNNARVPSGLLVWLTLNLQYM